MTGHNGLVADASEGTQSAPFVMYVSFSKRFSQESPGSAWDPKFQKWYRLAPHLTLFSLSPAAYSCLRCSGFSPLALFITFPTRFGPNGQLYYTILYYSVSYYRYGAYSLSFKKSEKKAPKLVDRNI